eukprot:Nk52_evm10s370 gene=Nk52_evmTU10s370
MLMGASRALMPSPSRRLARKAVPSLLAIVHSRSLTSSYSFKSLRSFSSIPGSTSREDQLEVHTAEASEFCDFKCDQPQNTKLVIAAPVNVVISVHPLDSTPRDKWEVASIKFSVKHCESRGMAEKYLKDSGIALEHKNNTISITSNSGIEDDLSKNGRPRLTAHILIPPTGRFGGISASIFDGNFFFNGKGNESAGDIVEVDSISGDCLFENVKARAISVFTKEGKINFKKSVYAQSLAVSSCYGSITADKVQGEELNLSSSDGDISIESAYGKKLKLSTGTGDVNIGTAHASEWISISSEDGSIATSSEVFGNGVGVKSSAAVKATKEGLSGPTFIHCSKGSCGNVSIKLVPFGEIVSYESLKEPLENIKDNAKGAYDSDDGGVGGHFLFPSLDSCGRESSEYVTYPFLQLLCESSGEVRVELPQTSRSVVETAKGYIRPSGNQNFLPRGNSSDGDIYQNIHLSAGDVALMNIVTEAEGESSEVDSESKWAALSSDGDGVVHVPGMKNFVGEIAYLSKSKERVEESEASPFDRIGTMSAIHCMCTDPSSRCVLGMGGEGKSDGGASKSTGGEDTDLWIDGILKKMEKSR